MYRNYQLIFNLHVNAELIYPNKSYKCNISVHVEKYQICIRASSQIIKFMLFTYKANEIRLLVSCQPFIKFWRVIFFIIHYSLFLSTSHRSGKIPHKYEKTLHKNLHVNSRWTMLEAYDRYYPTSTTTTILDSGLPTTVPCTKTVQRSGNEVQVDRIGGKHAGLL
jgi:hypothetical protein